MNYIDSDFFPLLNPGIPLSYVNNIISGNTYP